MKRSIAALSVVLAFGLDLGAALAQSRPDRVLRDAAGREVERITEQPDGTAATSRTEWSDQVRRTVLTETRQRDGRLIKRRLERFDDKGRLSAVRAVDVDAQGHERGSDTIYSYDARGVRTERRVVIE
jgi:hypothetical protein